MCLLSCRNGFYAFESALHVFPMTNEGGVIGISDWNSHDLWRRYYEGLAEGYLFFAEDVFGYQFCAKEDAIFIFDPETGEAQPFSNTLEAWAEKVINDYKVVTGHPIAHEWQRQFGPLEPGCRLFPLKPFFAGGEFSVSNLKVVNSIEGMRARGPIASQIRNLPDGSVIEIKVNG
ncbi:MAG: SMI1/KNR4 family protein [Alphaproteobacteria bacterium]|nr:SMI1/KNR4 family protein [Alphaproteobacteria bacterium]